MQRLRLYTSGIKPPPLGSSQDVILRKFLALESRKEIEKNRFLLNMAAAVGGGKKEWVEKLGVYWNTYVSLELGVDTSEIKEEEDFKYQSMLESYERVKKVKLTAVKRGKMIVVDGIKGLET